MTLPTYNFLSKTKRVVASKSISEDHDVKSTEAGLATEEVAANAVGSGKIAGVGVGPDGEPGKRKKKPLELTSLIRRAPLKESYNTPCSVGVVGYSSGVFDKNRARQYIIQALKELDNANELVSGLTDVGVPAIAYSVAEDFGLKTVGIACLKAYDYPCYPVDEKQIIGTNWGDESSTFLDRIDVLIRVGGGEQSIAEVATFKQQKPHAKVIEFELERK